MIKLFKGDMNSGVLAWLPAKTVIFKADCGAIEEGVRSEDTLFMKLHFLDKPTIVLICKKISATLTQIVFKGEKYLVENNYLYKVNVE